MSFLEIRFTDNEELCERLKLRLRENLSNSFGVEAERWQFYNFKKIITCLFSFLIFTVDPCFISNPFIPKAIYQSNLPGLHSLKSFCSIEETWCFSYTKIWKIFGFPGPNIFKKYLHWLRTIHEWRVTFYVSSFSVLLNVVTYKAKGQNGGIKKIWRNLFCCYLRVEIRPFCLITGDLYFLGEVMFERKKPNSWVRKFIFELLSFKSCRYLF